MLTKFSDKTASWLVKSRVIDEEDFRVYSFAVYNLLFTSIPIVVFVLVCSLLGCGTYALILIGATLAMRRYTGGYHASKPSICIVISLSSLCACVYGTQTLNNDNWVWIGLLFSSFIIWLYSPIDSQNYRLKETKKRKYCFKARVTLVAELSVYSVFTFRGYHKYALCFALGIILSAVLLAVCIPRKRTN